MKLAGVMAVKAARGRHLPSGDPAGPATGMPSTRYQDLVDLVLPVLAVPVGPSHSCPLFALKPNGAACSCLDASPSQTGDSGNPATRPKQDAPPGNGANAGRGHCHGHAVTAGLRGVVSCSSFAPMSARSVTLETFPTWVRGSASMSSRRSGHLYLARPSASR
jgi:hypothetical protein